MMTRLAMILLPLLFCTGTAAATPAGAGGPAPSPDAAGLYLALERLQVLGSVLYVAAHPDDENTTALAFFAQGRHLDTAYLSLTRGGGGQNLIGDERGPELAVLRTQELLAARRVDGARQYFTRAVDFGYSKSAGESMAIWGKEEILGDMVWVIRQFRPDVIISRFPVSGGGHGHHTASALLTGEAFAAAGDPDRFPEQLDYVTAWQPRRLFWNDWRPNWTSEEVDLSTLLAVNPGDYNPLLGESYAELAARSRTMHKSQGFGSVARRGQYTEYFQLVAGEPVDQDLFDGIDTSWGRVPGAQHLRELLDKARRDYDFHRPSASLPVLLDAWQEMGRLPDGHWIRVKREELREVIRGCTGLWLEAIAADHSVAAGESLQVTVGVINRSPFPFQLTGIRRAGAGLAEIPVTPLAANKLESVALNLPIPDDTPVSQPFWLRSPPSGGTYAFAGWPLAGLPGGDAPVQLEVVLTAGQVRLPFTLPLLYRWRDPVEGEKYRPVSIVPPVMVRTADEVLLFPDDTPRRVALTVISGRTALTGRLRLSVPDGWTVTPAEIPLSMSERFAEQEITVELRPGAAAADGDLILLDGDDGRTPVTGLTRIDYAHIPLQTLFPPARVRLVRLDLQLPDARIGYIAGAGDDIPPILDRLGLAVEMLGPDQLETVELNRYDTIVTGVRAFNTRPELRRLQPRLMEYVRQGGHLVVQYSVSRGLVTEEIGPYPFQISRDRVTVEETPVTLLQPDHPLLNRPNRIGTDDFSGWVQERGLYFAGEWDERYDPLLAMADPGEEPSRGSLLFARYGEGTFIYTGLAFFRQLPAGVPGACRLFVNLLSGGRHEK